MPNVTINRSVVIVRPNQPFVDWIASVQKKLGGDPLSIDLNEEGNAYLIPDESITGAVEAYRFIEKRWKDIFEQFLFEWVMEDSLWPQKRTLKMFREWFELIYAPMTWDLDKGPLEIEEWDDMEFDAPPGLH